MNKSQTQEIWRLAGVLLIGAVVGLITSTLWPAIAIALLAYCLWLLRNIFKLDRWIEKGLKRSAAPDEDSLLLSYLVEGHQLFQLVKVDSVPSLRTTIGPDRSRDHHLGREDDYPEFLHPDHDHYRDVIRIVLPS